MKRMTYRNLMKKCQDGTAEVNAWAGDFADVTFYGKVNSAPKREHIEVTNIPQEVRESVQA